MLISKGQLISNAHVEGEQSHAIFKGGNHNKVEGELNTSINANHDVDISDSISIAEELSNAEEIFEEAYLDFDPLYPLLEKWTSDHPREQILRNPKSGVLIRA